MRCTQNKAQVKKENWNFDLEPNAFAHIAEEEHDEQASSSSSSGSDDGEADESGNESELSEDLALVQPSLAAEIARDRDRWGDDMYD